MNSPARMTIAAGVVVTFVVLLTPAALADWAYTKWGMTQDQVVAASGGTVTVLPPAKRTRNDYDQWELAAEGTFAEGPLKLPIGFTFDTQGGGLKCVMYNAIGADVETLRTILAKRYGKPAHISSFGPTQSSTWRTPDDIELVIGEKPVAAVVSHCRPK